MIWYGPLSHFSAHSEWASQSIITRQTKQKQQGGPGKKLLDFTSNRHQLQEPAATIVLMRPAKAMLSTRILISYPSLPQSQLRNYILLFQHWNWWKFRMHLPQGRSSYSQGRSSNHHTCKSISRTLEHEYEWNTTQLNEASITSYSQFLVGGFNQSKKKVKCVNHGRMENTKCLKPQGLVMFHDHLLPNQTEDRYTVQHCILLSLVWLELTLKHPAVTRLELTLKKKQ